MELVVILKPEIVRQFKALGVLKKIDSKIFCYLNSKTLKKETKKHPKNLPKKNKKNGGRGPPRPSLAQRIL
jgi:hypothetical protein